MNMKVGVGVLSFLPRSDVSTLTCLSSHLRCDLPIGSILLKFEDENKGEGEEKGVLIFE